MIRITILFSIIIALCIGLCFSVGQTNAQDSKRGDITNLPDVTVSASQPEKKQPVRKAARVNQRSKKAAELRRKKEQALRDLYYREPAAPGWVTADIKPGHSTNTFSTDSITVLYLDSSPLTENTDCTLDNLKRALNIAATQILDPNPDPPTFSGNWIAETLPGTFILPRSRADEMRVKAEELKKKADDLEEESKRVRFALSVRNACAVVQKIEKSQDVKAVGLGLEIEEKWDASIGLYILIDDKAEEAISSAAKTNSKKFSEVRVNHKGKSAEMTLKQFLQKVGIN